MDRNKRALTYNCNNCFSYTKAKKIQKLKQTKNNNKNKPRE